MTEAHPTRQAARRAAGPQTPRGRALRVLLQLERDVTPATVLLERLQHETPLSRPDASLAAAIVLGVLRRRLTLAHLARTCSTADWSRVSRSLRAVMEIGLLQLCEMDRIPPFAAVSEAVNQAKAVGGRKAAGLVNAVLREFLRRRGARRSRPEDLDERRWLPAGADGGFVLNAPIWPDPTARQVEFISLTTSHPAWVVRRWLDRFGPDDCRRICEMGIRRPPLVLRPNRARIDAPALSGLLRTDGFDALRDDPTGAVQIAGAVSIRELAVFEKGLCQPQDLASQSVLLLRPPVPGEFVLDLCAGAGTKATHAAELLSDRGVVLASDRDARRLAQLRENAARLGLTCIRCVPPARLPAALNEVGRPPDLLLVDAPCSNSGVFARRPEARYRLGAAELARLSGVQDGLLDRAADFSGPGTALVYSTCSLEPEENEQVVQRFCIRRPNWRLETSRLTLPDPGGEGRLWRDGGFVARLSWAAR